MRTLVESFLWILAFVLHWWWGNNLSVFGLSPDFIFTAAIATAAFTSPTRGAIWAFFAGLYMDMYIGTPIGANAMSYTLIAWVAEIVARRFDLYDRLTQSVAVFVFTWPAGILTWILCFIFAHETWFSVKNFISAPFMNALIAPFVFFVALAVKRTLNFQERE